MRAEAVCTSKCGQAWQESGWSEYFDFAWHGVVNKLVVTL